MTDYSPFPESALRELAQFHTSVAGHHPERSYLRYVHEERAKTCEEAIEAHDSLRDRCLLSELNLGQAEALLAAKGISFQRAEVEAQTNAA